MQRCHWRIQMKPNFTSTKALATKLGSHKITRTDLVYFSKMKTGEYHCIVKSRMGMIRQICSLKNDRTRGYNRGKND